MSAPTGHAAPFYCAYCGDEDIRPFDPNDGSAGHGQWRCNSCQRAFALKYLGLVNRSALVSNDLVDSEEAMT